VDEVREQFIVVGVIGFHKYRSRRVLGTNGQCREGLDLDILRESISTLEKSD
jgi:hypothetical protein